MNSLVYSPTTTSPGLNFDPYSGNLTIKGRAIMTNAKEYWSNIKDWMHRYSSNPAINTTINFQFEYLNSMSTTEVLKFLKIAETILMTNKEITINWIIEKEDEDLYDLGQDINRLTKHKLNVIELDCLCEFAIN